MLAIDQSEPSFKARRRSGPGLLILGPNGVSHKRVLAFRAVSLENVLCDVKELQRGMELTWREFSVQHNSTLKDFISRNESRLNKLQEDARIAKVMLHD